MQAVDRSPLIPVDPVGAGLRPDHRYFGTAKRAAMSGLVKGSEDAPCRLKVQRVEARPFVQDVHVRPQTARLNSRPGGGINV